MESCVAELGRLDFAVANAFYWQPQRRYDYVRTNVEYVPEADRPELVARSLEAVAPGGRLIVCHYPAVDETPLDVARWLRSLGHEVPFCAAVDRVRMACVDRP